MLLASGAQQDSVRGLLTLVTIAAVIIFLAYAVYTGRKAFRLAGEKLGVKNLRFDSDSLSGEVRGLALHAHVIPGGKNSPAHMAIEVSCQPCAILLDLRRETATEAAAVAVGEALDLTTGDSDFDAAWIVEGAPAARVLRLLEDTRLRAKLLAFAAFPEATVSVGEGRVKLYRRGSDLESGEVATVRIELALALAEAVAAESEKDLPEQDPGAIVEATADYRHAERRPGGDDGVAQLLALRAMRGQRALRGARPAMFLGHLFTPAALVLMFNDRSPRVFSAITVVTFACLQVPATLGSVLYLRHLRKGTPELSFDTPTRAWIAGSWVLVLGLLAVLAGR